MLSVVKMKGGRMEIIFKHGKIKKLKAKSAKLALTDKRDGRVLCILFFCGHDFQVLL